MLTKTGFKCFKTNYIYKAITLLLSVIMLISTLMTGTLAWTDFNQHKTNSATGSGIQHTVMLHKYEKDTAGITTVVTVKDAEFYLYDDDDVQLGGRYVTDADGKININNIETGDYYFLETNPSYGYTYDKDGQSTIAKYYFTIRDKDVNVVVHAFNRKLDADLVITKEVKNADDTALTATQRAEQFTFTITFSDSGSYSYTINGVNQTTLASGGTLKLKHGDKALFTGLPVGVLYTVTETPVNGYIVQSSNHQGNITTSGATAQFVNTYNTGTLEITKKVSGNNSDTTKEFEFTVTFQDGGTYKYKIDNGSELELISGDKIKLKHDQTAVFNNLPVNLEYTVTEDDYTSSGYAATVKEINGTVIKAGSKAEFHNINNTTSPPTTTTYGSLEISKQVSGSNQDTAKEFIFTVTFSGGGSYNYKINDGATQTLTSGGTIKLKHGQTAVFQNLLSGMTYTVTENDYTADGYTASVQKINGAIVPNSISKAAFHNYKGNTTLTVKKQVMGEVPTKDKNREFSFTITINGIETKFKLKHNEEKPFTLPIGAVYEVVETNSAADDYMLSSVTNGRGTAAEETIKCVFTNTYTGVVYKDINGEKTWDMSADPSATKPKSITVYLKDGDRIVETVVVKPDGNGKWKYTFTAPKYDANDKEIKYTVEEKSISGFTTKVNGYDIKNTVENTASPSTSSSNNSTSTSNNSTSISNNTTTDVNTSTTNATTTINGSKTWNHGTNPSAEQPKSITIYLKDQYGVVLQKEISEANHWSWSFEVDKYDSDGNEYSYTVDEAPIPGYTKRIDGYNIINNHDSYKEITISGQKHWEHGTNKSKRPDSITVYVKSGDNVVAEQVVTAANDWKYTFYLPEFDENGNEINYSISEGNVSYYTMTKNGYDLTNTFKGFDYLGDSPKTGDGSNVWLWAALMLGSMTLLIITLVIGKRRKTDEDE